MPKIIGNTTATPNPRPDWNQTDPAKADYIKNKPIILTEEDVVGLIEENTASGNESQQTNLKCEPVLVDDKFVKCVIHGNISNCLSIETNVLPNNAKVKRVEIPDIVNSTNKYVSLEDLVNVDPIGVQAPYFVMYPNTQGMFLPSVALVVFPITTNSFYDSASVSAFVGTTIKIYYEIEE